MASDMQIITIGLVFRNAAATLPLALKSVFCQTIQNWELVLIDDGSTDHSSTIAEAISDPRVRLVRHHDSRGLAVRLNEVADLASGRYLARMDADDVMHPDRLRSQLEFLKEHPDCDVVDGAVYVIDETDTVVGRRGGHSALSLASEVITNKFIIHPTVMAKTEWFRANRYDEKYVRAEDHELWCRTWRTTRFNYLNTPSLFYRDPSRVQFVKYERSARTDRMVYRTYGPAMVGSIATTSLILRSSLKQWGYRVARLMALDGWLLRRRNSPLTPVETRTATELLRSIDAVVLPACSPAVPIEPVVADRTTEGSKQNRGSRAGDAATAEVRATSDVPLTVGLVYHNASETLPLALKSIFCQTLQNWELILVDDGSTDASPAIATAISDTRVRVVRHDEKRGLAARLNEIANLAKGSYLARMDADDVMHPDRLRHQVEFLQAHPDCDVVDSAVYVINERQTVIGRRGGHKVPSVPAEVITNKFIVHPTVMAKTAWFRRNKYDERCGLAQDHELWCRTWSTTRFGHLSVPLLFYRQETRVNLRKYKGSAQTDRTVYRTYGPKMVGIPGTASLLCVSFIKQACYAAASVVNLDWWLLKRRNTPLMAAESVMASNLLRSIDALTLPE